MKKLNAIALIVLFLSSILSFGQQAPTSSKVKITGKVIEKTSKQPLEYATITLRLPNNPKAVTGGITNNKGEFSVEAAAGNYDITVEFISFKSTEFKGKTIDSNTNLGTIGLAEDAAQLNEVVVRAEKTTVEIKLDKKVFNVGNDLMVKGGTVSDVLGNIPSVSVDVEGNVSLRGNENVKILIDGRPSNRASVGKSTFSRDIKSIASRASIVRASDQSSEPLSIENCPFGCVPKPLNGHHIQVRALYLLPKFECKCPCCKKPQSS
ncbi:MAG: hypothetical protein RLZ90_701 [Pseudomonadota bacterium]